MRHRTDDDFLCFEIDLVFYVTGMKLKITEALKARVRHRGKARF